MKTINKQIIETATHFAIAEQKTKDLKKERYELRRKQPCVYEYEPDADNCWINHSYSQMCESCQKASILTKQIWAESTRKGAYKRRLKTLVLKHKIK